MKQIYKYIHFDMTDEKPKNLVYGCYNNSSGSKLGTVEWYGQWRQYCYFADSDFVNPVVYSSDCLDDISNFVKELNIEHKLKSK